MFSLIKIALILLIALSLSGSESIVKEVELKACGMFEKRTLFSHILALTLAEPNEAERAKLLITDFIARLNPVKSVRKQLTEIASLLAQPEELIGTEDSGLFSKSELQEDSTALMPLVKIIDRIRTMITHYPQVEPLLEDVLTQYLKYGAQLLSVPMNQRKSILEPKALLSGEGLFNPITPSCPHWARVGFFSGAQEGVSSYRIGQGAARYLASFDEFGQSQASGLGGTNYVSRLRKRDFSVYFKRSSVANDFGAGNEACFYWLAQLLFARGITPTSVLSLTNVRLPSAVTNLHVLQASQGVGGIDFETLFKKGEDINKISLESFSEHIILSLLANPSDAHYGNLKLVLNSTGLFDIVGIDNDKAFDDELVKQRKKIVVADEDEAGKKRFHTEEFFQYDTQIKTILYCLPQMDRVVSQKVSKKIVDLDIPKFMLEWLDRLHQQNYVYNHLSQLGYLSADYFLDYHGGSFPIQLSTRVVAFIIDRLQKMQLFFKDPNNYGATHWNLVFYLSPVVARFYQEIQKSNTGKSPLEIYDIVHSAFNRFKSDKSFVDFVDLTEPINTKETVSQRIDTYLAVADKSERNRIALEDHIKKLLRETDLFLLKSPGTFVERAVDSFVHLLPTSLASVDDKVHISWFDPDLLFLMVSHEVPVDLLQFLLKRGVPVPVADSGKNKSLLAELVAHNYDPQFLAQMVALSDWQPVLNKKFGNRYPLDFALANTNYALVDLLVAGGAYFCSPPIALAFYKNLIKQQKTAGDAAFVKLLSLNGEVEWLIAVEELLPPLESGIQGMHISTSSFGDRVLHPETERSILKNGCFIPVKTPREDHIVCKATRRTRLAEHTLYFKIFHELPGIEETVSTILRTLPQVTTPFTELTKFDSSALKDDAIVSFIKNHSIQDKKITGIPVLISQGVTGTPLADASAGQLKSLSFQTVSGLICSSFCINPEDGHLYNFVVRQSPLNSGEFELVSVDNKRAFVKAVVRKDPAVGESVRFLRETTRIVPPTVQVKTALYCLDEMDRTVDPKVRERFLQLDIDTFLNQLLTKLEQKLGGYNTIFSPHEIASFQTRGSYIKIPFEETAIDRLYAKLVLMKELLSSSENFTHRQLLAKLEKLLAKRYDLPNFVSLTLAERFTKIDGPFYPQGHTMTQSRDLIDSWACPQEKKSFFEKIKASMTIGPIEARKQLQQLTVAQRQRTLLSQDPESHADAVNNDSWADYIRSMDFGALGPMRQELLLDITAERDLSEIALLNCSLPIYNWVSRMNLDQLKRADFRGCPHLDKDVLTVLSERAKQLRTLNISGTDIAILENNKTIFSGNFFLDFPQLEQLVLSGCRKLTAFSIRAPQLRELYIDECDSLKDDVLDGFTAPLTHLRKLRCAGAGIREKLLRQLLPQKMSSYFVGRFAELSAKDPTVRERWKDGKLTPEALEFVRQKATVNKYAEILYALLQRGIPADQLAVLEADSGGNNVLHYATANDDVESVKTVMAYLTQEKEKLVSEGKLPGKFDNELSESPFDIAVIQENPALVRLFLAQDLMSINFSRALSVAKNSECIELIIAHLLANPSKETESILGEYAINSNPLLLNRILEKQKGNFFDPVALMKRAIDRNKRKIVLFLLDHVLRTENTELESLLGTYAVESEDTNLLEGLLQRTRLHFKKFEELIRQAVQKEKEKAFDFLFACGFIPCYSGLPDEEGNTLMHYANNRHISTRLFELNPCLIFVQNENEDTPSDVIGQRDPMSQLFSSFRTKLFERIHDPLVATLPERKILLFMAAYWGMELELVYLLRDSYFETCKSEMGWSALHFAVRNGQKNIVEYLGKQLPSLIKARTKKLQSAFHIAARFKQPALLKVLKRFEEDFDFNSKDSWGRTPLHWATVDGVDPESIKILLANGARVDELTNGKNTALALVFAYTGQNQVRLSSLESALKGVKLLVDAGAAVSENTKTEIRELEEKIVRLKENEERRAILLERAEARRRSEERRRAPASSASFDIGGGFIGHSLGSF